MSETLAIIALFGRVIFSIPFLVGGLAHFRTNEEMIGHARSMGAPAASMRGWVAGIWLLTAGSSLALGVWPDVGALMVVVWGMPSAYFLHGWWRYDDEEQRQHHQTIFMRNLAFIGAGIALFALLVHLGDDLRYSLTSALFDF